MMLMSAYDWVLKGVKSSVISVQFSLRVHFS